VTRSRETGLVAFAERLMALLDQGSFVATYKYALLLGLLDLCLEKTARAGTAPTSVTTVELAMKVLELYWPHTEVFEHDRVRRVLRQNTGRQASILTAIQEFRARQGDPSMTLGRARTGDPEGFRRLLDRVEWTLILMPLPRFQVVGQDLDPFVYQIDWDLGIERQRDAVRRYQRGDGNAFNNLIRFQEGVGDHLARLNGLIRPLLHRGWAAMVARINGLPESELESFLFGVDRTALAAVRPGLVELQRGCCFYCGGRLGHDAQVDHFIPWARRPDNGIHNLVVADRRCNGGKRDFLPASGHVAHWLDRNHTHSTGLDALARQKAWESHPDRTLGTARGIYLRLASSARLWVHGGEFEAAQPTRLRAVFG
jgi:hypothetical protein